MILARVAESDRLLEQRLQLAPRRRVVVEPEPQLEVGELQVALLGRAQVRAGFEVVRRDAQLRGELPQRLDRRPARTCLDPRDVGVGDARRGKLALRQVLLDAKAPEALPDSLYPDAFVRSQTAPDDAAAAEHRQPPGRQFMGTSPGRLTTNVGLGLLGLPPAATHPKEVLTCGLRARRSR